VAVLFSIQTPETVYQWIRSSTPEDLNPHQHLCKDLKPHIEESGDGRWIFLHFVAGNFIFVSMCPEELTVMVWTFCFCEKLRDICFRVHMLRNPLVFHFGGFTELHNRLLGKQKKGVTGGATKNLQAVVRQRDKKQGRESNFE
jgi:hypothetical protein